MIRDKINDEYFEWMGDLVFSKRYSGQFSYDKLLKHLHNTEFIYSILKDENRADDGIEMRYRFAISKDYNVPEVESYLEGPCSVFEMIVALAVRCEETYMDDPAIGNRTGQWFWGMIVNLGLGSMYNSNYDEEYVNFVLRRFLHREYDPDGKGGLFRVRYASDDLRTVEIWYQLCWYLDSII